MEGPDAGQGVSHLRTEAGGSTWMVRVQTGLALATLLASLGAIWAHELHPGSGPWPAVYLAVAAPAFAVVGCIFRARRDGTQGTGWYSIGAAVAVVALGCAVPLWNPGANPGWPATGLVLFALFAMFGSLGVVQVLQSRVTPVSAIDWADATIAGLGAAAVAAVVVHHLAPYPGSPDVSHLTGGLATFSSVLLAGVVAAGLSLGRHRTGLSWWLLAAGLALGDAAGIVGFERNGHGLANPEAWTSMLVIFMVMLIGAATAVGKGRASRPSSDEHPLGLAAVGAGAALFLLVCGLFWPLTIWAAIPAVGSLLAVAGRGVIVQKEVRALFVSQRQARTDDLTGLANRRYFYERLGEALENRPESDSLAVLIIDLDRFKEINDSLGHHVGDQILRLIGPRLTPAVGVWDLLARLGGDEFAVLADGADFDWALNTAKRLRQALKEPFPVGDVELHVDASIGIAMFPDHADRRDELLARADIAMYRAKAEKAGIRAYEDQADAPTPQRLQLLELLRSAVNAADPASHGLVVHYQPKLRLSDGTPEGVEALVRFNHPDGTLLFPDLFIAMIENAGLMESLTLSVMRIAMRQCADWRRRGIRLEVAVNVSTSNLLDLKFPNDVIAILKACDLPPSALVLEITESGFMRDRVRCLDVLHRLRAIGIKIAVDDYGTGHSSLAYLRDLPADELKLDRSFVQGVTDDPKIAAIVESTVALAHALDLRIVAEGVETDEDLDWLRGSGCDVIQGFLLSRPLSPRELTEWYLDIFRDEIEPQPVAGPTEAEWRSLNFAKD